MKILQEENPMHIIPLKIIDTRNLKAGKPNLVKIIPMIPTHFRFRDEAEADRWNCTTKDWITISEIHMDNGVRISTPSFAWVDANNLDFAVMNPIYCIKCKDEIVTKKGDICEYCYENRRKKK